MSATGSRSTAETTPDEAAALTAAWVDEHVPEAWREAAARGGAAAIREVRPRADYEAWYPTFAAAGLVVPTWPVAYGGLDVSPAVARAMERELAPFNLGRLNPLGLNLAAPALFAHGTEEQRLRFLPQDRRRNASAGASSSPSPAPGPTWPRWPPGPSGTATPGSSPARRCGPRGPTSRTSASAWPGPTPAVPKRKGITYFLVDLHAAGVTVRPLRHITGEIDFNEVFLDEVVRPRRAPGRRGRGRLVGGQRHALGRASDGVGLGLRAASTASAARGPTG